MRSKFIYILVCTFIIIAGCKKQAPPYIAPTLDVQAKLMMSSKEDLSQILLKIQLLDYEGDLMKYGINKISNHQERISYYSSRFKEDIFLVNGRDTLPCLDSHFERHYMDLPYRNFILVFAQQLDSLGNTKLLINERQLSNQIIQVEITE